MKTEKLGQDQVFPILEQSGNPEIWNSYNGINKRFYAACAAKDDFLDLPYRMQCNIVGRVAPEHTVNQVTDVATWHEDYITWVLEGKTKWKYMQADELLTQENE